MLGIGVAWWLIHKDIDMATLKSIDFDGHTLMCLSLAVLAVIGRDMGLSWRFHTIAAGDLSWKRSIRTDIMCAFTSAITPSVVGGSAMAIFYLNREGIAIGRATTLTLTTLFLDELFFVIFCPIIVLLVPWSSLFGNSISTDMTFLGGMQIVFWLVYSGIVIWTIMLYLAIIGRPDATSRLLHRISEWRILRRFSSKIHTTADNMTATSAWVKGRSIGWWANVFGSTILSWFSRYFVVSFLFLAFVPGASMLTVFARQAVVWVVLMVSPTPGGSGISEWLFATYYGDLIGNAGMAAVIALLWRLLSYYIYIIAGCALLPGYFEKKQRL